jgi:hypothetical protein
VVPTTASARAGHVNLLELYELCCFFGFSPQSARINVIFSKMKL